MSIVEGAPSNYARAGLPPPWPRFAEISATTLAAFGCTYSRDLMQSRTSYSYRQGREACSAFTTCATDDECLRVAKDAHRLVKDEEQAMLQQANDLLAARHPHAGWRFGERTPLQPPMHRHDALAYLLFFGHMSRPGTFFDIGADDGVHSNTLFFERALNWTGVCVEPSPDRFALLQANRPSASTTKLQRCAHPNKTSVTMFGGTGSSTGVQPATTGVQPATTAVQPRTPRSRACLHVMPSRCRASGGG